jgi:hypothetical protein
LLRTGLQVRLEGFLDGVVLISPPSLQKHGFLPYERGVWHSRQALDYIGEDVLRLVVVVALQRALPASIVVRVSY